ncbi:MAG: hypothetical protein K6F59_02675 [Gammaproteobacteria bacterium]|nr:hypothetical protein [Gammaproteobacteria bacterium]
MLEFIKTYYAQIILGAVVLALLILVLISIFKRPKNKKKDVLDSILSINKDIEKARSYKDGFFIFKRGIQDYYLYLYDKDGLLLYSSEVYSSVSTLKEDMEKIKEAVLTNTWDFNLMLNNLCYLKFRTVGKDRSLGHSSPFELSELDERYKKLESYFKNIEIPEEIVKDLTLLDYEFKLSDLSILKHRDRWKIHQFEDEYYFSLENEINEYIFYSESCWNKKDLKKKLPMIKDSIRNGNFKIDKTQNGKFFYLLENFNNEIIYLSCEFDTFEEANNSIKEIIKNL